MKCTDCGFSPRRLAENDPDAHTGLESAEGELDYFEVVGCRRGYVMCPECGKELRVPLSLKLGKGAKREFKRWKRRPEILLCPNIPAPMHGLAPRVVLGQSWWNATRRAAYASTNQRCQACGVDKYRAKARKWLEGHELYDIDYYNGRMTYVETVPLCHFCHNYIHDGRMLALLKKGLLHHQKYAAVLQHGDQVLAAANLARMTHAQRDEELRKIVHQGMVAPWEEWRMVVEGREYEPLYKNVDEWRAANDEIHGR